MVRRTPKTESSIRIDPHVIARRIGDETIIVHLKTNRIYVLNVTASRFWELLTKGWSLARIRETLVREFEVSEDEVTQDIDRILRDLAKEKLIHGRPS